MDNLWLIMILMGVCFLLIGGLLFLVVAFRESIWWGLACIFIPVVQLFFLIVHWQNARKPFFIQLLGLALIIAAAILNPNLVHH